MLRIAIITARNAPAHERLVNTLSSLEIETDELFLMGGIEKKLVLDVLKPHIFFDDQLGHLTPASDSTPSVHIPFGVANISGTAITTKPVNPSTPATPLIMPSPKKRAVSVSAEGKRNRRS